MLLELYINRIYVAISERTKTTSYAVQGNFPTLDKTDQQHRHIPDLKPSYALEYLDQY